MPTLDWISAAIASYGYLALFLAAVVEGPIATVIAAFLASQGLLDIGWIYAVAVVGDLIGDLLFYGVGRSGKMQLRMGRRALSERYQQRLAIFGRRFRAHAGATLLFAKLTHAAGFFVLLAAGAARVPVATFLGYNLLGTLPKAAAFMLIGYFAGAAYTQINSYLWIISAVSFPLICLGIGINLRRHVAFDQPEA